MYYINVSSNVGQCQVLGEGSYYSDSEVIIEAIAAYGYHFTQWNDGNADNPRTITVTQDSAFTAIFAPNIYMLALESNDTTIGTVIGAGSYNYLDTVQIVANVVASHHHFVQWNDSVTAATRTIVIVSDTAFAATFAIDTHSVSVVSNDDSYGTVTGSGDYPYGASVELTATPADGYYFVMWGDGDTANPRTVTVTGDTTFNAVFSDVVTPGLCMVSVQENHNVVIWTKELEVVQYNIYREGITTGSYDLVASLPYDSLSRWVDTASNPMSRSYRYKMTAVDSWGNESPFSDVHKTMHLTISQGMGNQWNLMWNEYVGAEFVSYMIFRGTSWSNMQIIDQMSVGDNTSYTDVNAPEGTVYYQVAIVKSSPCNITKSENIINSNIATNDENPPVGIGETDFANIGILAVNGNIYVTGAEGMTVRVYDVMGRLVATAADATEPVAVQSNGVYIVKVGELPARKVVVLK